MIKNTQRDILTNALTFENKECPFRLLILDSHGYLLVSSLFKQSTLYELGFTLFLDLNSQRQPIPAVPAVYLVSPTEETIKFISSDVGKELYEQTYIIFTSPIPTQLLKTFADSIPSHLASKIISVRDTFMDFISPLPNLFTFNLKHSLYHLASSKEDQAAEQLISSVCNQLFHVCSALNTVPIIKTTSGSVSATVASQLDSLLRQSISQFSSSPSRPLLILVDRVSDLSSPLLHSWGYHSMLFDLADKNIVKLKEKSKIEFTNSQNQSKMIVLDDSDYLFADYGHLDLLEVTNAVEQALDSYQKNQTLETQWKKRQNLKIRTLAKKKESIDAHTRLGHLVLDQLRSRHLDEFIELESQLINLNGSVPGRHVRDRVKNLIGGLNEEGSRFGDVSDRVRLLLIYYICANVSLDEIADFIQILKNDGADLSPLEFCRELKLFTSPEADTSPKTGFRNLAQKGLKMMTSMAVANIPGLDRFKTLPIISVFNSLFSAPYSPSIVLTDPKLPKNAVPRSRTHDRVLFFVLGGISITEYYSLLDYCKYKRIEGLVGSTDLWTSKEFMDDLSRLGSEKPKAAE
ncbi:hypothetical protein GEMRC1_011868 [Eukaryota sp. GEM-RC1]